MHFKKRRETINNSEKKTAEGRKENGMEMDSMDQLRKEIKRE